MTQPPFRDVTDAELAVLATLWELGRAPIRELMLRLYPDGSASSYATVQKLLGRLEDKGCVGRDRSTEPHLFAATVDRDELIARRLQRVADSLCEGSLTPLLTQLMARTARRLSPTDRAALRALVDTLDANRPKEDR